MQLQLVESDIQKKLVKNIIEKHHSYVPTAKSVGRRIDWLIYEDDKFPSNCIGMIGIGSSVYPPPKDMLNYIGMSKNEYKDNFNSFANNWRFCMTKSIKNAGTQILKQVRELAPVEWKTKYGDDLTHLITFVGGGNNGAVYKADNWDMIGKTAGLPKHKVVSMKWNSKEELKQLFVKPTGENKKLIFAIHLN
jgi:hypothetical protein|tara:strand:- start:271 stop:846 length:576 start_codon:yes stop_codon:yes gene_type:complete